MRPSISLYLVFVVLVLYCCTAFVLFYCFCTLIRVLLLLYRFVCRFRFRQYPLPYYHMPAGFASMGMAASSAAAACAKQLT